MALEKIIAALENLEGPDRQIDQSIALQVGYTLSINPALLPGERERKNWWFGSPPKEVRLPKFTESIESAIDLAKLVGVEYDSDDAVAICLSSLKELQRRASC
ncbi:hypothetical protein CO661_14245 [Sinorhizobium fredii]|uniref:Uncharacterized protein n=1 Tax=Rhizobium fredii TaxID=380 RepID=A0A2A6LYX9_RHIFR|nr:hypothetical protein [Sinorhizobium fredii]PDT47339.1 hypothetical protein CO661_14245 [Sinorhizobium fredii]